jgi:phosphohistidine phosphatase
MSSDKRPYSPGGLLYELCIMRHGISVSRGTTAFPSDDERPLTPEGKRKMKEIGRGLARLCFKPDWVISSPLIRARQTAVLVAEILSPNVPLDCSDALRPRGSLDSLLELLGTHPERRRTIVVGHETDLSQMAASLIGASRHAHLGLKKGGCCLIRFEHNPPQPPGELIWWLTPRILREAAER